VIIITQWGGDKPLKARVRRRRAVRASRRVSALGIEERRVNVVIDFVSPREEWKRLGHGYQLEASIVRWRSENALQVPVGALFRQGEAIGPSIASSAGKAQPGPTVTTGHMNDAAAEIVEGLSEGDSVIFASRRKRHRRCKGGSPLTRRSWTVLHLGAGGTQASRK
jgi:HlyD family secretion protein